MITNVVTFHADPPGQDWYAERAARLAKDCAVHGIPCWVFQAEHAGCWQDTCLLKPRIILQALRDLRRPVLWVDADSSVVGPLDELDVLMGNTDVAAVRQQLPRKDLPVLATVLWFNCTPAAVRFLEGWAAAVESADNCSPDHDVLCRLWQADRDFLRLKELPPNWCWLPGRGNPVGAPKILFGLSSPPGRKHVRKLPEITAVVTACRRLGLMGRMMDSLRRNCVDLDQVSRWLIVDDGSSLPDRREMSRRWPHCEILYNKRHGHHESVNLAYERIATPLTLWLEDDWEFHRQGNLIHECFSILLHDPRLAQVGLPFQACQPRRTGSAVPYRFHLYTGRRNADGSDSHWPGFTLNPNLHWTDAVRACLPAKPPEFEHRMARRLRDAGRWVAHCEPSWCRHVGEVSAYTLTGRKK
ncbi:MAG TPA: hypothetical protein PK082_00670 [Phycisphaerae bacterium]|nr:hypothetical protein [Phycisphaerae bacterium]